MSRAEYTTLLREQGYETDQDLIAASHRAFQMVLATETVALHYRIYEHDGLRGYAKEALGGRMHVVKFIEVCQN